MSNLFKWIRSRDICNTSTICFDGSESVTQVFSASITADVSDLPYTVTSYSWDILSSNSGSAIKTDIDSLNVSYEFTASGEYTLEYLAIIDGTNSDCSIEILLCLM